MKVLIADDSRVNRQIIGRLLRQAGIDAEAVEAEDGDAALVALNSGSFDLILSEWNLPEISGMQLLRMLRGKGVETPFVFFVPEMTDEMKEQASNAGAQGVFVSPWTPDDLSKVISPLLTGAS